MMTGLVTEGLEAIVRVGLRGPLGVEYAIDAVLDTGFTGDLVASLSTVEALGLPLLDQEEITLADDSVIPVSRYEGTVLWDGQERKILIHCLEGDSLLGMSLLRAHLLMVQVVAGGQVTITPFAPESASR